MKSVIMLTILVLGLMVCAVSVSNAVPMGTAWTYQGRLIEGDKAGDGLYDLTFSLFDDPCTDTQQGAIVIIDDLDVIDGYFTVDLDFGGVFDGHARWLEIAVRPGASVSPYTILIPRQEVTPTPYALYAQKAEDANTVDGLHATDLAPIIHTHSATSITSGTLSTSRYSAFSDLTREGYLGNAAGDIAQNNGILQSELNADVLDGFDSSDFLTSGSDYGRVGVSSTLYEDKIALESKYLGISAQATDSDRLDGLHASAFASSIHNHNTLYYTESESDARFVNVSGDSMTGALNVNTTGTGYAGSFGQTGPSNTNGGLNVTTAAGQYGAQIFNQGGYSGNSYGLQVTTEKDTGSYAYGLRADTTSTNSFIYGGYFKADTGGLSTHGIYVDADNTSSASGNVSYGIQLVTDCDSGRAYGLRSDVGVGPGSTSPLYGIYSGGDHGGTSGNSYGMWSSSYGSDTGNSYGIYSWGSKWSSDTAGTAYGGYFIGDNDRDSGHSYGLYTTATGLNGHRYGLFSEVTTSSGTYPNFGVGTLVSNNSGNSYGFFADLDPGEIGYGVYVDLDTTTSNTDDQHGLDSSVIHNASDGYVMGIRSCTSSSDTGNNYAGYFFANSNLGDTGNLYGLYVWCDTRTSGNKYAGYFQGNVHINGELSKSRGSFKIDHPLDPENKYLSHSFVESPDMMNVYNGNVTLDKNGEAVVKLPDYFEALNRDFRYQLTCIGGFAPVYIAEKISDNCFKIAGGTLGMEVSWQVTGIRQDAYAKANPIVIEETKSIEECGYYLNPTAYGLPEEKGIESVRNPIASKTRQVAKGDVSNTSD